MRGMDACATALAWGLAVAVSGTPALAQNARALPIDTAGQSLAAALTDIARRSGRELLLAAPTIGERAAPRLKGRYTLDQALPLLLAGSGLGYRRTADGSLIIEIAPYRPPPEPDVPVALPELLVTGRSQNSDIQRTENDIRPYKVWSSRDIERAHPTDVNDLLRVGATGNAQILSAAQDPSGMAGSNRSEVNLRGLGSSQTLVLIDGRRLAGLPTQAAALLQPDLNGLPLAAIERVELLTATAGGVYGAGATAGVVNIVLKRDYDGVEIGVTQGLSARGDAATRRLDGRLGFSPDGGRTDIMLVFSQSRGPDLRAGDRDNAARARGQRARNDPVGFAQEFPAGAATNIWSAGGALSLVPALGSLPLEATTTFVPVDYGGVATDKGAALTANAGRIDATLGTAAEAGSLLTRPKTASGLITVRRRFGAAVEAYVDLLGLNNEGRAWLPAGPQFQILPAGAPTNPFIQTVLVSFPTPGFGSDVTSRIRTGRATVGAIAHLPGGWKANLDYSFGATAVRNRSVSQTLGATFYGALARGLIDPLGDQRALRAALETYRTPVAETVSQTNRFRDGELRLAGAVTDLPGGPLTLSLLAEDRREHVPGAAFASPSVLSPLGTDLPDLTQAVRSYYAELRAPLIPRNVPGLSGLELQLAVRRDRTTTTIPANLASLQRNEARLTAREDATVYTVGFKAYPLPDLMVRASAATGVLPPALDQIASTAGLYTSDPSANPKVDPGLTIQVIPPFMAPRDPKRGGAPVGIETPYLVRAGGSTNLRSERARSLSVGVVLTPSALNGLRASLDYTRIDKTREIVGAHSGDLQYFIDDEDLYPGRVSRAALTSADQARGYAGGVITGIDTTALNTGRTVVEAVDLQVDYRLITGAGDIALRSGATWQPRLSRRKGLDDRRYNLVGHGDGPLEWRSTSAIDWNKGAWTLGLSAHYYGAYRIASAETSAALQDQIVRQQGAEKIPAQVYFDLAAGYRLTRSAGAGPRVVDIRLGVLNVLDHRPPTVAATGFIPYSPYGDPRRRRLELSLVGRF